MKLKLSKRDLTGKKVKSMRSSGLVPATIYGPKQESLNLQVDVKAFRKVFNHAGYNNLVQVEIDGENIFALIKEVQSDPIRGDFWHVSMYAVDMAKQINTEIPLVVEGLSPAVKNNIGILVNPITHLTVRCLPKDLPNEIVIDVSNLSEVGDNIKVSDLKLPEGVEFGSTVNDNAQIIAVAPPQKRVETTVEGEGEGEEGEEGKEDEGVEESKSEE
jgi:large subunit ribosomal protein L25